MSEPIEPVIVINGQTLSVGEAMSVRVAVGAYQMEMTRPGALGEDAHGKAMVESYRRNLNSVTEKIMLNQR